MRRTLLGLIVATTVGGGPVSAHHSCGAYFEKETVLTLRTDASAVYTMEWPVGPNRVRALGAGAQPGGWVC